MSGRRGFTLIELTVAITLAAVLALLAYGAASAGIATERRVRERDVAMRAERAWRAVVEDALRNVRSSEAYGRPALELESDTDARGRPTDRLWFVTAGGIPPLTPDADWEVTLQVAADGLVLVAVPIGVDLPARRVQAPPSITGMDVRVFLGTEQGWRDDWPAYPFLPRALGVTYWSGDGPAGATSLLAIPQGVRR